MDRIEETVELEDATPQAQKPQQAPQAAACPGDCRRCQKTQRDFCSAQIAYNLQFPVARLEGAVAALSQALDSVAAQVGELRAQVAALKEQQETELITPGTAAKKKGRG